MIRTLKEITSCIEYEMEKFEKQFNDCFSSEEELISSVLSNLMQQKGKRVRPILTFLIANIYGKVTLQTYRVAIIIELLHTASLLHDDVIDKSLLRRGKSTINSIFGDKVAILIGDYLYGKALATIKTEEDFSFMDIFSRIALKLPTGEFQESRVLKKKDFSISSYLEVIRNKTAYLIQAAVICSARSCGSKDFSLQDMESLGQNIGMAFQIKDDVLDYTLNNNAGKGIGNDIRESKITMPLIYCLNSVDSTTKEEIENIFFEKNKTDEQVTYVLKAVNDSGAVEKAIQEQQRYSKDAMRIVDNMPLNDYSVALRELVQYLTDRNK